MKFVDPNGKAAWEKKRDWDPATDAEKYGTFVNEEYARLRQETEGKEPTVFKDMTAPILPCVSTFVMRRGRV